MSFSIDDYYFRHTTRLCLSVLPLSSLPLYTMLNHEEKKLFM